MGKREGTRPVYVGDVQVGGQSKVVIQTMANVKTEKTDEVAAQIKRCASSGAELMRLSVLDFHDAEAIAELKRLSPIPLIADIHFDYRLALACLESGIDAIRINPGNIGDKERIKEVVDSCRKRKVPIRIGVNSGSMDSSVYDYSGKLEAAKLVESAEKHVKILESLGFFDIVVSLKGSSALTSIEAYRLGSSRFPYPLHLGVTEAGPKDTGLLRSAACLSPLLLEGIGDTVRISLSDDPEEECLAARRLLHDLGLYPSLGTFISCPTCGRTQVDLIPAAKKIQRHLEKSGKKATVAIMGCVVNGPGEAKQADLGAAGGKGVWAIFKKGKVIRQVKDEDLIAEMEREIDLL